MSLHFFVLSLLNGLSFSALLFLISIGFSLIFGLMRIINIAHASLFVLGIYLGITIQQQTGSFLLAVIVCGCFIGGLGFLMEKFLLARFHGKEFEQVLLTVGLMLVIDDIVLAIWGGMPIGGQAPALFKGPMTVLGVSFPKYRLVVIAVGIITAFIVWFLIDRTKTGAAIRAGADNEEMAKAIGINVSKVFLATFALGSLIAGAGGVIGGPIYAVEPGSALEILTLALVVVTVGGPGTVAGVVVGSLFVGLVDSFGRALFPSLAYFTMFLPMAVILIVRPQGLLGRFQR